MRTPVRGPWVRSYLLRCSQRSGTGPARRRCAAWSVIGVVAAVGLNGCAAGGTASRGGTLQPAQAATEPPSSPLTPLPPSPPSPPPATAGSDTDSSAPLRTDAPAVAALGLAAQAMARFVPAAGESADQWFTGLAALLSAQARQAYAGTDPATVPVHTLLGAPSLAASSTAYLATVDQATDAGPYEVLCSRADDGSWQVERIEPASR